MKKYQIVEYYGDLKHAGSKATNDVVKILDEHNFEKLNIFVNDKKNDLISKIKRQVTFFKNWKSIYNNIERNGILVIQHPFRKRQLGRLKYLTKLKSKKNVTIISLIHDVELIRNMFTGDFYQKEFEEMLTYADKFIVHNDSMKKWFIDKGINSNKIVTLNMFDYFNDKQVDESISFSNKVIIAGNLGKFKSPYVYKLHEIKNVDFELLGIGYDIPNGKYSNINYLGSFLPEEVPLKMNYGFGLVWDGDSLETCSGNTGNYLRYNNPHKLSLYISSGIPVIVWSESAVADFVLENKIGFVVDSLFDLNSMLSKISEEEYYKYVSNVKIIMKNLKTGYYTSQALKNATRI
ncbi:glycosyl transferase [Gemella sp. GH3]|uniref:glycosyl transferase n=1 Tax=unclassified Gemella TaxID=2624949 RepID=UPI0015D0D060|nr:MULTISPECIES: glycosyl transferase [unclassified Gemella]MBF0713854.1 glycosyl transferase [Gemella sp. GH3.1]NYS50806.1 glycosyl transferase [Gemella sp. GH3]